VKGVEYDMESEPKRQYLVSTQATIRSGRGRTVRVWAYTSKEAFETAAKIMETRDLFVDEAP
jgi:hypothetical protein